MANEPIYDVASMDSKNKLCSAQTVVETRLLPMGGVSIFKVLSYTAESFVAVTDVFTGEARVSGRITFKVLFLDEGGTARAMETNVDFTDKITCDALAGGRPQLLHRVLDIDILSVSGGEIKLAAIVEMDLFDNISSRIKFLSGGGDSVFAREERVEYQKLAGTAQAAFSLSDEIPTSADKILSAESFLLVTGRYAGDESITVEGQIITNIVAEEQGEIISHRAVTPFSNQSEAQGCRAGCIIEATARLLPVRVELVSAEDSSAILLDFSVEVGAFVYTMDVITPVLDAFSITNELSIKSAPLTVAKNHEQKLVLERVEGSVSLSAEMPIADKILAAAASKLSIANSYIEDDRIVLEGAVSSSILYFSAETGTKNSVDVEIPFSITTDESAGEMITSAQGEVVEISAKIRRGSEIDIKAEIAVTICSASTETTTIVTELTIGDAIEIPSSAISLHIARGGEGLWEVAKALRSTPEVLLVQNPDLELPLKGGERVMIYRHLKK